jgi:hypothetical protein
MRGVNLYERDKTARRLLAAGAALQLLVALPLLLAHDSGSPEDTRLDVASAPLVDEPTTTTGPSEVAGVVYEATTTTLADAPTTVAPPTTLWCRNSTDPRCGPFRWDPEPGPNAPLTVTITFTPERPKAYDEVRFFVTASDPDARITSNICNRFGDETSPGPDGWGTCISAVSFGPDGPPPPSPYCAPEKYGPWSPPPPEGGSTALGNPPSEGVPHTFTAAGTYRVGWRFTSASEWCGPNEPYASTGEGFVHVVVAPAGESFVQQ